MRKWLIGIVLCVCVPVVGWYGWLFYISKDARKLDGANFFVTFHDNRTGCDVRMGVLAARHELPCADVVPYVRDLKLPAGATFTVADLGGTHGAAIASLTSELKGAGYVSVGRLSVSIAAPPEPPDGNR